MRNRILLLPLLVLAVVLPALAMTQRRRPPRAAVPDAPSHSSHVIPSLVEVERINREIGTICIERSNDPLGSTPIDEMQMRPSLPVAHSKVLEGLKRSERLLPLARTLAAESIRELARENGLPEWRTKQAVRRILAVDKIKPEMDLRDNASVYYESQKTIHFGTIFLASLQSDEGMISILAHELTHIGDGKSNSLRPLFHVVAARASRSTGLQIDGGRPEELTCDLIGVRVARKLIDKVPSTDSYSRRFSRSLEHNCVSHDETDEVHLSPRNTMRAVLALDPFQ
jgi:hypothetical protein